MHGIHIFFVLLFPFMSQLENIELRNLAIGYRSKGNEKTVATSITATVNGGELTCLLGQNGIGKSTLLRTLSAFQPALGGEIFINGTALSSFTDKELSRHLGVVLTEKPDLRNMTARELVELGRSPYTGFWGGLTADDEQVVDDALQLVGIGTLAQRLVHTLSDGERQKVMIAKALAQQTPIIYLDEPTAFLDFPSKVEVLLLLRRICRQQQKTIFLSTHDLELALQVADRIWLMDREKGLCIGTPAELAADGALSHFVEREDIAFDRQTLTIRIKNRQTKN